MQTQVGIIGAGPAGLLLAHLLHLRGIASTVLERRSRDYVERRVRAGVLEHRTVEVLRATGVGDRMEREGLVHHGLNIAFDGELHRIHLSELTGGRPITVYGQQEVVKDLIRALLAAGVEIHFEAEATGVDGIESERPTIRFRSTEGEERNLECQFAIACDGSHGIGRSCLPQERLRIYEKAYPYAWLGILASAPPSHHELIYAHHPRGFALQSMRTPSISRLYLQVAPDENLDHWPDQRIWAELRLRLGNPGQKSGPILERGITPMRSFVAEPMQHGRLFLAGDAAHIVPPTGAKGMNLAVRDVLILSEALAAFYGSGDERPLAQYTERCLRHVWRAEHFSYWMTTLLHTDPAEDAFSRRLRLSHLRYLVSSKAAQTSLAENYTGWEG